MSWTNSFGNFSLGNQVERAFRRAENVLLHFFAVLRLCGAFPFLGFSFGFSIRASSSAMRSRNSRSSSALGEGLCTALFPATWLWMKFFIMPMGDIAAVC